MPRSWRYSMTELPGTLQRSCREAQETFLSALDDAVRIHGAGDHWIAKEDPAGCGGGGETGQLAARGNSRGQQIQRPAS